MNYKERKKNITECDMTYRAIGAFDSGLTLGIFHDKIRRFEEETKCNKIDIEYGRLVLIGATRSELIAFIRIFGGKWQKKVNDYYPDKIDYNQKIPNPLFPNEEILIEASQAEPPPSCQIIEVEEMVPASVRKVKKIQCKEPVEELEGVTEAPKEEEVVF